MDDCGSSHSSTTSTLDELENIHISSSSSDSDDSDMSKFYYSDSEPESLSNIVFPVQYNLPKRNHSKFHSSTNRTLMNRMAPSNRSIRMKHGITALDIMVPLNRDTTTTLKKRATTPFQSGTTQRNLTTALNSGTVQYDTTTQFGIPTQNALRASSYVPTQWRLPSSSLTVPTSYNSQVPIPPLRSRSSAPPYSYPPPYITPYDISIRSQFSTPSYPTQINRNPLFLQTYTFRTSSPFYNSRSPSLTYSPQSSLMPNIISQTSKYYKRSKYPVPPYVPPYSCPPYTTHSVMPAYTSLSSSLAYMSQSSTTFNTSQTSTSSIRFQPSKSFYSQRYRTPTDSTSSFVQIYTSQTSTYFKTTQSSTLSCSLPYSKPPCSSKSSVLTHTSQSSTLCYNLTSPSLRMNPRSAHYSASPSYSHYSFPQSTNYTITVSDTYYTEIPQLSTQNSYPSSVYDPSINIWPTKIGSVMQTSMENIWLVLSTQLQNASQPSTTACADLLARRPNDQSLNCVNPKPPDSIMAASNACDKNNSKQPEEKLMLFYKNYTEKKDIHCNVMQHELYNAWVYLNKMEVVDIKPNGEIKCICPTIKFEDLLKSSINDKRILVNLYHYYKLNKLLFESTYDYNSSPPKTIVTENKKNDILQWLIYWQMDEYDWFFDSLSLFEIENINPTNIQKFITRSKSNKTISLEDQLKICCIVKKIKEWPVSLVAILMNLREGKIDEESLMRTVDPYITEISLFPLCIKHFMFEDIMKESIIMTMIELQIYMTKLLSIDTQPDTNITTGDFLATEMVNSEII